MPGFLLFSRFVSVYSRVCSPWLPKRLGPKPKPKSLLGAGPQPQVRAELAAAPVPRDEDDDDDELGPDSKPLSQAELKAKVRVQRLHEIGFHRSSS